jgi:SAM-dependent methyltransferase
MRSFGGAVMKPDEIARLYDDAYARAYDERFLIDDFHRASSDFEVQLLRGLLTDGSRWLDVGCGTGYHLSKFPGVARAGLDLSQAMLDVARVRNPDALEIRQGDFRQPIGEWTGEWTLVSCMWAAFSYVDTIGELGQLVSNMIAWTAPGGALLIPTLELPYLGANVPYSHEVEHHGGPVLVNGYIWSWDDTAGGKHHCHMILPHTEQFVAWLAPHFDRIELVAYPDGRRALVAIGRHDTAGRTPPAMIVRPKPSAAALGSLTLGQAPLEAIFGEILRRLRLPFQRRSGDR